MEHIVDETRRSFADFSDFYISPSDYVDDLLDQLDSLEKDYRQRIFYKWFRQKYYVEVWLEKNAMFGTFRTFLEDKHVRIVPNRGYGSWSYAYVNCKRIRKLILEYDEKEQNPFMKEIHILYFGDYDPSGKDMDRTMKEQLEYFQDFFGLPKIFFHRIAITKEQIRQFRLPIKLDEMTKEKLERDTRYEKFMLEHDNNLYAVELDALLAYQPDEFKELVLKSIEEDPVYSKKKFYDPKIFKKLLRKSEHSKKQIGILVTKKTRSWLRNRNKKQRK